MGTSIHPDGVNQVATRKAPELDTTPNPPIHDNAELEDSVDSRSKFPDDVEVKSISLEEFADTGDPYNNTGQHVILELNKKK